MLPLLIDEGLPRAVAAALSIVGWSAHAVGDAGAPPRQSEDEVNCQWCADHDAVLVTNDHGKKDRKILDSLAEHHVHALFVRNDLRAAPAHALLRALLIAETAMDEHSRRTHGLLRHYLKPTGRIERR